jgi:hypothetical protein
MPFSRETAKYRGIVSVGNHGLAMRGRGELSTGASFILVFAF